MPGKAWTEERADLAEELGARVRAARAESPYSIRELAAIVRVQPNTIWQIEMGKAMPDSETLMRIAAGLGTTVEELLPDGYLERLKPPRAVLEWLGQRADFPDARLAGTERGKQSSRRSSKASSKRKRPPTGGSTPIIPDPSTYVAVPA